MSAGRLAKPFKERARVVTREFAQRALALDDFLWGWLVRNNQRAS